MSVSTLDAPLHALELEPDILFEIIRVKMVESLGAIPATEDIHQGLVYDGGVSESDIGLANEGHVVQHSCRRLFLTEHDPMHLIAL